MLFYCSLWTMKTEDYIATICYIEQFDKLIFKIICIQWNRDNSNVYKSEYTIIRIGPYEMIY